MSDPTPDLAELRRLAEAANADAVQGATYERDWPLSSRAVGRFLRALNPDLVLELLDAAEERDEIAGRLAALLCDLTGGRLSKTTYPVPVMVQEVEQYLSECHESDLKDERDELAAAVAAAKIRAAELHYEAEGMPPTAQNAAAALSYASKAIRAAIDQALNPDLSVAADKGSES